MSKTVLFLGLSTFNLSKDIETEQQILKENCLLYKGNNIGRYFYQMEPILLLYKHLDLQIDEVIYLYTSKTEENKTFICDELELNTSARAYFDKRVEVLFPGCKSEGVEEVDNQDVLTVKKVINRIRECCKAEDIQLVIDNHGGLRSTYILIQGIISLLKFEGINPDIIYTVEHDRDKSVGEIKRSNDISSFIAGMNEFLTYGRPNTLEAYYEGTGKEEKLVKIMRDISDSIQLCQISDFDNSIKEMSEYIANYKEEGNYTDLFIESVKKSYGSLMDQKARNKVTNKIKWCVDNDYIQQALTIIESQMPDEFERRNVVNYIYDDVENKEVKRYRIVFSDGTRSEIEDGSIKLKDALENAKQDWERTINYAFVRWLQKNCNSEFDISESEDYDYKNRDSGDSLMDRVREIYLSMDNRRQYIVKLGFKIHDDLDIRQVKNLFELHLALKAYRNQTNHSSGRNRPGVNAVKAAIYSYIDMADEMIDKVKKNN